VAIISNATTIADAGAFSVSLGSMVLIKTVTASNAATVSFVHGSSSVVLDSTYPIYKFEFINMHPITTNRIFSVGFRDGSTDYDATKTTTSFRSIHTENNNTASVAYTANDDIAQGTGFQSLANGVGAGNDESLSGEMYIFNPSSTTFVKHFIATVNFYEDANMSVQHFTSGYCNVTAAIDAVQFKMSSGNIDSGIFKLYGIKDS
jgi:hypothetical protein